MWVWRRQWELCPTPESMTFIYQYFCGPAERNRNIELAFVRRGILMDDMEMEENCVWHIFTPKIQLIYSSTARVYFSFSSSSSSTQRVGVKALEGFLLRAEKMFWEGESVGRKVPLIKHLINRFALLPRHSIDKVVLLGCAKTNQCKITFGELRAPQIIFQRFWSFFCFRFPSREFFSSLSGMVGNNFSFDKQSLIKLTTKILLSSNPPHFAFLPSFLCVPGEATSEQHGNAEEVHIKFKVSIESSPAMTLSIRPGSWLLFVYLGLVWWRLSND